MKRFLLLITIALSTINAMSQQKTADIGAYVGGTYPFGDYSTTLLMQSVKVNYGGFFRFNFNPRYALRINLLSGKVGAVGELNHIPATFSKQVSDVLSLFEFNYLEYLIGVKSWRFSPYLFLGAGMVYYSNYLGVAQVTPQLPVGMGFKYSISNRWGVSVEYTMKKLFNDALDNSDNPLYVPTDMPDVNDLWHNNDYIGNLGITVVYKLFLGKNPCPVYENY